MGSATHVSNATRLFYKDMTQNCLPEAINL